MLKRKDSFRNIENMKKYSSIPFMVKKHETPNINIK